MLEEINNILYNMRNDDLRKQAKMLGLKSYGTNLELTERILLFYKKDDFVVNTYKELNAYEKEYLDNLVQQSYTPTEESVKKIKLKYKYSGLFLEKVNYFFINKSIPNCFKRELNKLIPPYEIKFTKTVDNVNLNEHHALVSVTDQIVNNIDNFIKYINEKNIKITSKKRLLPKKNCLEFINNYNILEVTKNEETVQDAKDISDLVIVKGIFNLLLTNNIISNKKEVFSLGSNYKMYIRLNKFEKLRFLLQGYLDSNDIDEVAEMKSGIYKINFHNYTPVREFILDVIKKLPIDKWVNMDDFIGEIRKKDIRFIRKSLGEVLMKSDYDNCYYNCGYSEFDYPLIDVCLIEYFAVLGLVDIVVDIAWDDYGYRSFLSSSFIKLTNLGAQVLKLTKESEFTVENIPLTIDGTNIIIPNNSNTLEHQLFFDRFAYSKKTIDRIVYDLSFKSIVKAIDLGISLEEIKDYLEENSQKLSVELIKGFSYYQRIINKVKIKKVTILEFPSELEEQIKNSNLDKHFIKENNRHIIIQEKKIKDVKEALENNNLFCKID